MLYYTIPGTILFYTILSYTILHYTGSLLYLVLYYSILYYTILYYTILVVDETDENYVSQQFGLTLQQYVIM